MGMDDLMEIRNSESRPQAVFEFGIEEKIFREKNFYLFEIGAI